MNTPYDTLIEVDELVALISAEAVTVLDCRSDLLRPEQGRVAYEAGHIPGAHYADLNQDLSDPDPERRRREGRHPLPAPAAFAQALARWGIDQQQQVVVYDQQQGAYAARLWWLLRASGHRAVAVLNGGYAAWTAKDLPLSTSAPPVAVAPVRTLGLDHGPVWDSTQLEQALADERVLLVDARAAARYAGLEEPIDPVPGHIPGAINRPYTENLLADGRFKSAAQLHHEWQLLLAAHAGRTLVHSCGSGVTACHNLLACAHAGLPLSVLYAPSYSGWLASGRSVRSGTAP